MHAQTNPARPNRNPSGEPRTTLPPHERCRLALKSMSTTLPAGVTFAAPIAPRYAQILSPDAIAFIVRLQRSFNARRKQLLTARAVRQAALDAGARPDFLPETKHIRNSEWTVAPLPADLLDRRAEITGPVDRKMIINALNSGAKGYMADFQECTTTRRL